MHLYLSLDITYREAITVPGVRKEYRAPFPSSLSYVFVHYFQYDFRIRDAHCECFESWLA